MGLSCGGALLCLSFLCFLIGAVMLVTRGTPSVSQAPAPAGTAGERRRAVPPRRPPPTPKAPPPVVQRSGNTMNDRFFNARIGENITVKHPQRGQITGKILGTIHYTELWQRVNSPSEPWVPTGNTYAAHWLGNFMLYEWQNRLYLLDEYEALTDQDVQANFLPYARKYAQSDQTAKVTFAWPPASWTITDIGKFSVERAEGSGLRLNPGATGRFIHATGADNRALVVEDYQSGSGGQDTAWIGWQVAWEDINIG